MQLDDQIAVGRSDRLDLDWFERFGFQLPQGANNERSQVLAFSHAERGMGIGRFEQQVIVAGGQPFDDHQSILDREVIKAVAAKRVAAELE